MGAFSDALDNADFSRRLEETRIVRERHEAERLFREKVSAWIDSGDAAAYARGVEASAAIAEAHDATRERKAGKRSQTHYNYASEEAQRTIEDEERGEKIAAEVIAKAIRSLIPPTNVKGGE